MWSSQIYDYPSKDHTSSDNDLSDYESRWYKHNNSNDYCEWNWFATPVNSRSRYSLAFCPPSPPWCITTLWVFFFYFENSNSSMTEQEFPELNLDKVRDIIKVVSKRFVPLITNPVALELHKLPNASMLVRRWAFWGFSNYILNHLYST